MQSAPEKNNRGAAFRAWAPAIVGALAINLLLFGLMPGLVTTASAPAPASARAARIHLNTFLKSETPDERESPTSRPVRKRARKTPVPPRVTPPPPVLPAPGPAKSLPIDIAALPALSAEDIPLDLNLPAAAVEAPSPYSESDLDNVLSVLYDPQPDYPLRARRMNVQNGWVRVGFTVTRDGRVDQIRILSSDPPGLFDQSVISAVSSWRFKPGTVAGEPVETRAERTIRFRLR